MLRASRLPASKRCSGPDFDSGLAGLLAGDLAVADFIIALVPSYWTIAMLAIQYSGILSCSDDEKVTAMKRDARLCVEFGDYCSSCISVFGKCVACLERTKSYCCFNSHLARIINEQGRAQVGKGWGSDTARNPDCSGFSVAQLQSLDFSRMDLSRVLRGDHADDPQRGHGRRQRRRKSTCVLLRERAMLTGTRVRLMLWRLE